MRKARSKPSDEEGPLWDSAHDYKRHGTTTLFAALNMLDGNVISDCLPRHSHQKFIQFLKKNCELSDDDIQSICDTFIDFKGSEQSKIGSSHF